ncbi:MAG: ABC transporter ATP-binding protein [Candidatus Korarchaeota archaeon]|nr:ABC transporter ATP-binding protein [Candidatus Korarchaeota archaeon]NIU85645.1 ATP-binding cassette domain-containing protein [Candidatus Thorarchaeota archaeon]NIW12957.1 ATP-binding cassette domain-containing protein [Candidatus Thorarchaeota archaeon]NIW51102.1 ATP-binding cassette domain-containing protein [Candidatus Korarchaeota archaeon]
MLKVKNLNAGYGHRQILYDLSMELKKNKISIIVGPNGAGKTTLIRSILGLTTIYSGEITLNGTNLTGLPTHTIVRSGITYLRQKESVFPNLTVRENLEAGGYLLSKDQRAKRIEELREVFPTILKEEYMQNKADNLSGGERRILSLAITLVRKPKVMLLDEPTAGVMPKLTSQIFNKIKDIRKRTKPQIIITEQKAEIALKYGDIGYLLVNGALKAEMDAEKLLETPEFASKYFGIA